MSLFDAARHRLRSLFRAGTADRERDEEFAFHQSLAEVEHVHATGDTSDAPYAAKREFGNVTYIKEEVRWMGPLRWIDQFGQDLRFAARTFRRSPLFAIVAVLSIGLGIGANTAVFGVINELMFKRLAVSHPEQLAQLWRDDGRGGRDPYFNAAEYEALGTAAGTAVGLLGYASAVRAEIAGVSYDRLSFEVVDGGLFPMLGVGAAAGRLLTPADDRDTGLVAVLGFANAVRHFGSANAAVGQQVRLQGHPFTIIGVLPREFRGLTINAPMTIVVPRQSATLLQNRSNQENGDFLMLVTRFADGDDKRHALERAFAGCCANGELVTPGVGTVNPILMKDQRLDFTDISRGITVGKVDVRDEIGRVLYVLMGGIALVLLMACTNIGSVLLARATVRSREFAVRMSLGASRGRVVRQLLAESVLLAAVGATIGLAVAVWGTALFAEYRLSGALRALNSFLAITPDLRLVGFTAGVAVICTVVFGVLPAIRATRLDPVVDLRTGSPGSTRSSRLDRGLIAMQMALALVLVASAGLLGATLRNLRSGIGDMRPDQLLVAEVDSADTTIPKGGERAVYDRILERLRSLPGVSSVAGTDVMPLVYMGFRKRMLDIPGFEHLATDPAGIGMPPGIDEGPLGSWVIYATPGFFATTGTGLVAGREFSDADVAGAQPVVIISEAIARQFFAGRDPIGQRMGFQGGRRALQVIGVARDVKQTDLRAANPRTVYLARAQRRNDEDRFIYAMRTSGNAADLAPSARAAIAGAAPEVFIRSVLPMSDLVALSVSREQALRTVAVVFSVVAVGLAAIGLYGVLAFQVATRTREIGIRMALGADRTNVVRMVMRQSITVVTLGIVVGVPLALGASSGLRSLLYGVEPFAPAPFLIAALVLVVAGLVAALLPSRYASRVDPLVAIRAE